MTYSIITHGDSDGLISAALVMASMKGEAPEAFFTTSPASIQRTLAYGVIRNAPAPIYILDIGPSANTVYLSAYFNRTVWIDHHEIADDLPAIPHVAMDVARDAKSAASVVADALGIMEKENVSALVDLADEIDVNNITKEEGHMLRWTVGYIKGHFGRGERDKEFLRLVGYLQKLGPRAVYLDLYRNYAERFRSEIDTALKRVESEGAVTYRNASGAMVAFITLEENIPVYAICDMLKTQGKNHIDIIVVKYIKNTRNGVVSKLEFRTQTNRDVLSLALMLGGGGHPYASGATVEGDIAEESILSLIELP